MCEFEPRPDGILWNLMESYGISPARSKSLTGEPTVQYPRKPGCLPDMEGSVGACRRTVRFHTTGSFVGLYEEGHDEGRVAWDHMNQ